MITTFVFSAFRYYHYIFVLRLYEYLNFIVELILYNYHKINTLPSFWCFSLCWVDTRSSKYDQMMLTTNGHGLFIQHQQNLHYHIKIWLCKAVYQAYCYRRFSKSLLNNPPQIGGVVVHFSHRCCTVYSDDIW